MSNKVRFSGTTAECFSAFLNDIIRKGSTDGFLGVRKRLEKLLELDESTVRRWFRVREGSPSAGKFSSKVKLLLDMAGYQQAGVGNLGCGMKELFYNFALGLISTKELGEKFGIDDSSVYRILVGGIAPTNDKLPIVEEINTALRPRSLALINHWRNEIADIIGEDELEKPVFSARKSAVQSSPEDLESRSFVVLALVDMVSATHRLASQVVSEQYTPAERRFLRSLCERSGHSIADCSVVLNALCGERATESYREELKQKERENGNGK